MESPGVRSEVGWCEFVAESECNGVEYNVLFLKKKENFILVFIERPREGVTWRSIQ